MREKCIKQFAQIVVMNVKFHSSLIKVGQYTAENVFLSEEIKEEDTKLIS